LAAEIARLIPGFDRVVYPDWDGLLVRFWEQAPAGTVLAVDELPALVWAARELPSLLQKRIDARPPRFIHLALAGSPQRMMHGLVLDRSAPLYGRAAELLEIGPLPCGWIADALDIRDPVRAVEAYAVWGGVPRYWELAAEYADQAAAIRDTVLSPLGVLHDEPAGLLLDDLRDLAQAASMLSLIGAGAHRLSEIAARLQKPATSLSRPVQRLIDLGLVRRETPFGVAPRDSKRTLYQIADPFLRFWFRFVEPNRSMLEARRVDEVAADVTRRFPMHVAGIWEDLARTSVAALPLHGRAWKPARRWWGPGLDRKPLEIDVVAESRDGTALLVGEVTWAAGVAARPLLDRLRAKAERFPHAASRAAHLAVWVRAAARRGAEIVTAADVVRALR
jgi:hypothetical protein